MSSSLSSVVLWELSQLLLEWTVPIALGSLVHRSCCVWTMAFGVIHHLWLLLSFCLLLDWVKLGYCYLSPLCLLGNIPAFTLHSHRPHYQEFHQSLASGSSTHTCRGCPTPRGTGVSWCVIPDHLSLSVSDNCHLHDSFHIYIYSIYIFIPSLRKTEWQLVPSLPPLEAISFTCEIMIIFSWHVFERVWEMMPMDIQCDPGQLSGIW